MIGDAASPGGARVGYYVHHAGGGHAARAGAIGRALARRGAAVTFLGSRLADPALHADGHAVVALADDGAPGGLPADADPTAGGLLHWAPLHHRGYRDRAAALAAWVATAAPDVVVVDVSVEVTLLVRLLGVPVVVVTQPGDSLYAPHRAGRAAASAILAPWPIGLTEAGAAPHLIGDAPPVQHTGGISALPARPRRREVPGGAPRPRRGVVLAGRDGFDDPGIVDDLRGATPRVDWRELDGSLGRPELAQALAEAEVAVTHAGLGALADVAVAGVPAVVVPQPRPHGEQAATGRALDALAWAPVAPTGRDRSTDWAALVDRALTTDPLGARWCADGAADRAAAAILDVVARPGPPAGGTR